MAETSRHITTLDEAAAMMRLDDVPPNCVQPLTVVQIRCAGCSEYPLMCHVVYPNDAKDGALEIQWDEPTVEYLRRHFAEHHA